MTQYNIVAETSESTVVAQYEPSGTRSGAYQSESELEQDFLHNLQQQGYEYLHINSEQELIANLRRRLEALNGYTFTDSEWKRFFELSIAGKTDTIADKTRRIQEDYIQALQRDDGTTKNILLIDKKNIHRNSLQVINQYENGTENGAVRDTRYDVTILVNGFPMVHVELKRRGVRLREAFNQIERYKRDSFWAGSGLYEYVQIFVISNGTETKYYSNTTRNNHIHANVNGVRQKSSSSFAFTSYWADAKNRIIPDLVDFTKTFFTKHVLLNILTKYCVFTSERQLLVMRPYQITATERILMKVITADNYKQYGSVKAGGYIWHTTGSGKTLTSFKTAQLTSKMDEVDKVIFVVDRKDLDYQTMKEYDRFEKGAANGNASTAVLKRQLEDLDVHGNPHEYKIIVTTIQKLSRFINANPGHPVYNKKVVLIFDECHRSQFGDMHTAIVKNFKKYFLFGFTGTPIFPANSLAANDVRHTTTEQTFGKRLHEYTIVDAIRDHNVLPFRVEFIKTMETSSDILDEKVFDIDREAAFLAPERIAKVTAYILDHFNQKTYRGQKSYVLPANAQGSTEHRVDGFNSILATSSIPAAKAYYAEFKKQQAERPGTPLKVALICSFCANEDTETGLLCEENSDSAMDLDAPSRDFLDAAIKDYNTMFGTAYDTTSEKFANYYKDVSMRMKNRELDLLIVVNMFLTGFDAVTLNTLWVDKNLQMHGLIQAFSRTNRILSDVKAFGNVVCFRNLTGKLDEAVALFGDGKASGIVTIKKYDDYYFGYTDSDGEHIDGYVDIVRELREKYSVGTIPVGDNAQKKFIALFGTFLRMRNILVSFDEFAGQEILSDRDVQDYLSIYQDLKDQRTAALRNADLANINDDVVFEAELVRQVEVSIDYVLMLVQKYHTSHCSDEEMMVAIQKAISSSPTLRSKKELIETFVKGIVDADDCLTAWRRYIVDAKEEALVNLIATERLNEEKTRALWNEAFERGEMRTDGTAVAELLPPTSLFDRNRTEKRDRVAAELCELFELFYGI